MTTPNLADCRYCIEGFQPSGVHLYLGPVYMICQPCIDNGDMRPCSRCNGDALFPADFTCMHCLAEYLAACGLVAVICGECLGVVDFRALEAGGTR